MQKQPYSPEINSHFLSNPSRPLVLGRLIIVPNKNNLANQPVFVSHLLPHTIATTTRDLSKKSPIRPSAHQVMQQRRRIDKDQREWRHYLRGAACVKDQHGSSLSQAPLASRRSSSPLTSALPWEKKRPGSLSRQREAYRLSHFLWSAQSSTKRMAGVKELLSRA